MSQAEFPAGWDEVRKVLNHYENQAEEEATAEDEAAFEDGNQTIVRSRTTCCQRYGR
jgi:hypothetical protein